jgi:G3E family GTPase
MKKVPVTIITGFLGSGKTTLVNNLIKKYTKTKFAVIENEFGEIGIDGGLISGNAEGIFELANGCICCTLSDDFYMTLSTLMESEYTYEHLVVETTGIADPLSVVRLFLSNEEIQQHFKIDSVICVADAPILEELIEEMPEIRRQIAVSDTILLNKSDLTSGVYIREAMKILNDINPMAQKFSTAYSDVTELHLLNTDSYASHSVEQSVVKLLQKSKPAGLLRSKSLQLHSTDFYSEAFIIHSPFRFDAFSVWMKNYLYFNERTVLRAKGILAFSGHPGKYIFHAVFGAYMLEEGNEWGEEIPVSKLVFIGRHVDRDELEAGLMQLCVSHEDEEDSVLPQEKE